MWEENEYINEKSSIKGIHEYVAAFQCPQLFKNDLDALEEELNKIGVIIQAIECYNKNKLCIRVEYNPTTEVEMR
jgi:hypothetical protein